METLGDFWFASFFEQSCIHTSHPFCRAMGLHYCVIPFWLALFLTSSMSHVDAAKARKKEKCWQFSANYPTNQT